MGACDFKTVAKGKTAQEAFNKAVADAQWDRGHGGYTGTIAEKQSFEMRSLPKGRDPQEFIDELMEQYEFDDKWGPAGCVQLGPEEFCFFGWASS